MVATRLEARYNPMIGFLPQLGLAAVLLIGGERVIHASLTLGQFSAFYLYLNMLITPMRSLGMTLNLAQRATASGARIFQLLDRDPRMTDAPGARRAARRERARAAARRDAALRAADQRADRADARRRRQRSWRPPTAASRTARTRGAQRHRPRRARRPHGGAGRRHRLGQDQPRLADLAALRRSAGQVLLDGVDVREVDPTLAAPGDRGRQRRPVPVLGERGGEHRLRPTGGEPRRDRNGRPSRAGARVRPATAAGLRDARGRARPDALRRSAPAPGDSAGAACRTRAC